MNQNLRVETLQDWLTRGRPVTVLDIRTPEDRAQWSIPGSVHVNAYHAVKAGDMEALMRVDLPKDRPLVIICNTGKVSQLAAEHLDKLGLETFSLAGGMKAWSLAWNTAETKLKKATVLQVRRTGKGCLSYIIGSSSEAVLIDASVEPDVYLGLAAECGWTIRYVVDTHVHADHLSRSKALAEAVAATLLLPDQKRVTFDFVPVKDGQQIEFGHSEMTVMLTPGHTMESCCYYLDGEALFTGDTLFISGVGRPDLHASLDEVQERARFLYRSLRRLLDLPTGTLVFPGHASEPPAFDRRPIMEQLGQVAVRIAGWLRSEDEFLAPILERIPPTPPNYLRIVEMNEAGKMPEGDVSDLEAGANRCAVS